MMAGKWQPGAGDLAAFAEELHRKARGAWVQRIYQPAPSVLMLHLYGAGHQMRLVVDVAPGRLAFGLLPEGARPPANPAEPPPFCMLLRKHVEGRRLQRTEAVPGDRVVLLFFGHEAAPEGEDPLRSAESALAVELTGRTADVVLVVQGVVAGWARQPGPARGLALHEPYRLPPPSPGAAPGPASSDSGPGPAMTLEAAGEAWLCAFEQDRIEQRRRELLRVLGEARRRVARRIEHQTKDLQGAERAEAYRRCGELLLTYAHRIPPGADQVVLPPPDEPTGETPLTIRLDPALSASGNAQAYFRRYHKARRAVSALQGELERARQLLASIETLQVLAREADTVELLEALDAERASLGTDAGPRAEDLDPLNAGRRHAGAREAGRRHGKPGLASRKQGGAQHRIGTIARFRSSDGIEILVGRSASANDHLTLHLARPGHLWLHARGLPGAHVVIRSDAARIPETTLSQAAALAARFSAQGHSGSPVPVDYTPCRHVRKPPGSPPGFVVYDHEKTVWVVPDPSSLPAPGPGGPEAP